MQQRRTKPDGVSRVGCRVGLMTQPRASSPPTQVTHAPRYDLSYVAPSLGPAGHVSFLCDNHMSPVTPRWLSTGFGGWFPPTGPVEEHQRFYTEGGSTTINREVLLVGICRAVYTVARLLDILAVEVHHARGLEVERGREGSGELKSTRGGWARWLPR